MTSSPEPVSATTSPAAPHARKAADLVADVLRRRIVTGQTPVGSALPPEAELLAELEVSRPTLRAALRILESEDLVTVRRGSRGGAWVNAPTSDVLARRAGIFLQYHDATLDDVHRARVIIEPPAVYLLAERADPRDVMQLRELAEEGAGLLDDRDALRASGGRFHRLLVDLAGNQTLLIFSLMLEGIIELNAQRSQAARPVTPETPRRGPERQQEHERVIDLIEAGAAAEAERFWREHLESVRANLTSGGMANSVLDLMS
jgi:DNA-binding FadR family transcriptional regulator